MYMTPYKKFYYYIIMVFEPFLFLVRKRNALPVTTPARCV